MKGRHIVQLPLCLLPCLFSSTRARILVDPVHNTCAALGSAVVSGLLTDVTKLAQHALHNMNSAERQSTGWDYFDTTTTYNTIFDATSPDSQSRWNAVKTNLQTMAGASSTSRNIYISCDDTALWTKVPGNPPTLTFHDPSNGQSRTGLSANFVVQCAQRVNGQHPIGYHFTYDGSVRFIVLCKNQNGGDLLLSDLSPNAGSSLGDQTTLSTVLFHELTHALIDYSMQPNTSRSVHVAD